MSYSYTNLKADLQSWLESSDADFVGSIDKIIELGEQRIIKDLDFTIFDATVSVNTAASNPAISKSTLTGYLSARELTITSGGKATTLDVKTAGYIEMMGATEGKPTHYAEDSETQFIVAPIPDAIYAVKIRYRKYPDVLSSTTENSWIGTNFGDGLFKACLAEAEKFIEDDNRSQMWEADYLKEVPGLKRMAETLGGYSYSELRPTAFVKQENERTD